jgi:hypothetical protein
MLSLGVSGASRLRICMKIIKHGVSAVNIPVGFIDLILCPVAGY